jgi:Undecaprenyl-phosphate galactose phosphotransferase WbaP
MHQAFKYISPRVSRDPIDISGATVPYADRGGGRRGSCPAGASPRPPNTTGRMAAARAMPAASGAPANGSRPAIGPAHPVGRAMKIGLDFIVAALALLLLSPLLLAIAGIVKADGGPALYAQTRVGRAGRRFRCLKFRTMVVDAEQRLRELLAADTAAAAEWASTRKLIADPRVTGIGALLRRTSLDELPQLLNVLTGDMSLVGPRPIVEAELARYADDVASYRAVRPGITGLWQVSGRSQTSYARRVQLDVQYVKNWSLPRDLAILLRTIPAVLSRRGAV